MADLALLKPKLARLKLSGMMDSLQLRFDQAVQGKWSFSDFLERLLQDEVERRESKQLSHRLVKSGLAAEKTWKTFDFSFTRIHEPSVREIALCNFMADHENVFFVGPSGVGKSTWPRPSVMRPSVVATRCSSDVPRHSSTGPPPAAPMALAPEDSKP